jgi:hypothetical protein
MTISEILTAWKEYANWQYLLESSPKLCERCDGEGYHGFEEESGCAYVCYACYGTGHYVTNSF